MLKTSILICLQLSANLSCMKENSRDALFCAFYFLVLIKQRKIISYCGKYWLRGKEKTQCWVDVIQFALQVLA